MARPEGEVTLQCASHRLSVRLQTLNEREERVGGGATLFSEAPASLIGLSTIYGGSWGKNKVRPGEVVSVVEDGREVHSKDRVILSR